MRSLQGGGASFLDSIFLRQINGKQKIPTRLFIEDLKSSPETTFPFTSSSHYVTPPFMIRFGSRQSNLLAVGDEEGSVTIFDTSRTATGLSSSHNSHLHKWKAHDNTVFDVCWTDQDTKILTASGDQTSRVWDVNTGRCVSKLQGHTASVKSVNAAQDTFSLFATGSRDGNVLIWDTRVPGVRDHDGSEVLKSVLCLRSIHSYKGKQKKRPRRTKLIADVPQSVTCVTFLPQLTHILATSGAADGIVKLWDLRMIKESTSKENKLKRSKSFINSPALGTPVPVATLSQYDEKASLTCERRHGISSISIHPRGHSLIASSSDNRIYMYDLTHLKTQRAPIKTFSGHVHGSFYVKSAYSGDGEYIVSGSSDHNLYVWEVARPYDRPHVLQGHGGEVSGVDWSSDFTKLASCSDDSTVRVWTLQRNSDRGLRRCLFPFSDPISTSEHLMASVMESTSTSTSSISPDPLIFTQSPCTSSSLSLSSSSLLSQEMEENLLGNQSPMIPTSTHDRLESSRRHHLRILTKSPSSSSLHTPSSINSHFYSLSPSPPLPSPSSPKSLFTSFENSNNSLSSISTLIDPQNSPPRTLDVSSKKSPLTMDLPGNSSPIRTIIANSISKNSHLRSPPRIAPKRASPPTGTSFRSKRQLELSSPCGPASKKSKDTNNSSKKNLLENNDCNSLLARSTSPPFRLLTPPSTSFSFRFNSPPRSSSSSSSSSGSWLTPLSPISSSSSSSSSSTFSMNTPISPCKCGCSTSALDTPTQSHGLFPETNSNSTNSNNISTNSPVNRHRLPHVCQRKGRGKRRRIIPTETAGDLSSGDEGETKISPPPRLRLRARTLDELWGSKVIPRTK